MGNDAKRTPGKWEVNPDDPYEIIDDNGDIVAWVNNEPAENEPLMAMSRARAALIVRAANAHDALVKATSDVLAQLKFAHGIGTEKATIKSVKALRIACNEAHAAIALATEAR